MNIAVIGLGYIGLANAIMLSKEHKVTAVDTNEERLRLLRLGMSPRSDPEIEKALAEKCCPLAFDSSGDKAFSQAGLIIVAVPTDGAQDNAGLDTGVVEDVITRAFAQNPRAIIAVRSTLPTGFTEDMVKKHPGINLLFVPEFSREGKSLYDCLYPSRIVVGVPENRPDLQVMGEMVGELFLKSALIENVPLLYTGASEAEAIKLFANTYLAMRIGFFNELDTFAELRGLNTRDIIDGLGFDKRIGCHYNNPSFGYGGNCLPKDASQLLKNYVGIPNSLISSISASNARRKSFIANRISAKAHGQTIGIYRLTMKKESDNYRKSSVLDVITALRQGCEYVVIYEPTFEGDSFDGVPVLHNLQEFKSISDLIVANRCDQELADVMDKVYTRDLYFRD